MSVSTGKVRCKELKIDVMYKQMLDNDIFTSYPVWVSDPVVDRGKSHLVMAEFLPTALP